MVMSGWDEQVMREGHGSSCSSQQLKVGEGMHVNNQKMKMTGVQVRCLLSAASM